jgi:membrane protein DedA with SNARE-associated domain
MHDLFAALAAWITWLVHSGGYAGVAILTVVENLFPPIPSELILPVAGYLVSQGELEFVWVVVASTVGSLAGALILYGVGYKFGEARLRGFVRRHGRWLALDESDLDRARDWFGRHGAEAVFICRLIPTARSIISIPAGLERMPLVPFILYTTLGSGLWNAALVAAGWLLGDRWGQIEAYLNVLEWLALGVLLAAIAWFLWQRKGRKGSATVVPRRHV